MSRRRVWIVVALIALVLVGLAARALMQGRASTSAAASAASAALRAIDLAPSDVAVAQRSELTTQLAVSGSLRAVNSAMLRSKVAAEVRDISVREGDRVSAGQLIGRLDDTEYQMRLRQAEDQAGAAKAQLDIAEKTLANNQALVSQGFISRTALDTSVSSAAGARSSLQAARAAADLSRKAVQDASLRAPIAGIVSQRLVQPGERVAIDAKLIEIVDLSRIELEAALAPEEAASLTVGQTAKLQVDGLSDVMNARVARINPSTQSGTRALMAYLAVDAHPALRQGLFARGQIALQRKFALVVPGSAVRVDQAQPYVLIADGGKVRQQLVSLGARGDALIGGVAQSSVEVLSGVSEGQVLLRGSVGMLREGTAVRLPAMQPVAVAVAVAVAATASAAAAAASPASAAN